MRPTLIAAIVVVVLAAGIAAYSVDSMGPIASSSGTSTPNDHSSSLGSSVFSSSSSTVQPAAQAAAIPYPLVWGPNPVRACSGWNFCIIATLGFADNATLTTFTSVTTITQGNATTILGGSTTTIIRSNGTTYKISPITSYHVTLWAFVQDAITGQNATNPVGAPVVASGCYIQPTGFTQCIVGAPYTPVAPSAPHYKVTLFVTTSDMPCSLKVPELLCPAELLAPPSPTVTGDFEG